MNDPRLAAAPSADGSAAARRPPHARRARRARRRPRADARHLRRRDPGARGRRPHVLGLRPTGDGERRGAVRAEARHGPPVLGRGPPLRDLRASSATGWAPRSASSPRTPFLYEAACNPDPVLRLTGVNRALEGLAIDVFNTMQEFGDVAGDPVLEFCEDWMLADEVTHVKMGSDWLRRLTAKDPERRERGARVPARRRQAVLARRLPRRGRRQPDAAGPPLPRAGRLRRRRDRRARRDLASEADGRGRCASG